MTVKGIYEAMKLIDGEIDMGVLGAELERRVVRQGLF
jgi:hypothetical protein